MLLGALQTLKKIRKEQGTEAVIAYMFPAKRGAMNDAQ
jgi:hypothetical protein